MQSESERAIRLLYEKAIALVTVDGATMIRVVFSPDAIQECSQAFNAYHFINGTEPQEHDVGSVEDYPGFFVSGYYREEETSEKKEMEELQVLKKMARAGKIAHLQVPDKEDAFKAEEDFLKALKAQGKGIVS